MQEVIYPTFESKIFNRTFVSNELEELGIDDLVILQDEVNVDIEDAKWQYKTLPKQDKIDGTCWVIQNYKRLKVFQTSLKRVVYHKTKSLNAGLTKSRDAWKKRALILGQQLGYTKSQVKELIPVE
jgi:hypothetical protein